jgi:hypothetical protein
MADTARGAVSMTPVITITADADTDSVDAIHHDFKSTLGGKLEVDTSSGFTAVKWWGGEYLVAASSADLIGGHTTGTYYGSDAVVGDFTDGTAFATTDEIKMVCVENLAFSDTAKTTTSTAKIYMCLDGGDAASQLDVVEIGPNESIVLKFKTGAAGVDIANLHAASSSGNCLVKVAALVNDGG